MREVERKLDWSRVQMWPGEMPKEIERQLEAAGVKMERLKKSVYVIRLNGKFCIRYPKGDPSPVIYIGRGDFSTRVRHHRRFWLGELEDLVGDFCFDIRIATPRVQNSPDAYKDCEAYMIRTFGDQFGSLPLWNKKKSHGRICTTSTISMK